MKTIFAKRSILGIHAIIFIVLSLLLMYFDHKGSHLITFHRSLSILVTPIHYAVDTPIRFIDWVSTSFKTNRHLHKENEILKHKQLLLKIKQQRMLALIKENQNLRALLQSSQKLSSGKVLVAEIIAADADPFVHQVMINKGSHERVYVGQAVIDAKGIIGQVIQVTPFTSQVLLLSDSRNAVPVEDTRSGLRGVVIGADSDNLLNLIHVSKTSDIKIGDELVSSGLGGRYPSGYPVGVVKNVIQDPGYQFATIEVTPAAQLNRGRLLLLVWPKRVKKYA